MIRGNLKAAEAALEHPAGEKGELVWDEFPHAIEYLVYAYLQKGENVHGQGFTWPEAISQFAHGLGSAHIGKLDDARAAVKRLEELDDATAKAGEELFPRNIRVLRLQLSAWIESSVALMQEAAELETSTPKHAVTPGPTLPAYELLGDLLMKQKKPAEALAAYKRSLELYPGRRNSVMGAKRAVNRRNVSRMQAA